VRVSFDEPPVHTTDTDAMGAIRLLEAVRSSGIHCRYYQASTSEMFGSSPPPQNEDTPFSPRSPCGATKVYPYWITKNYREGPRDVRSERHPLQPRVTASRRDLRDPQDHSRGGRHQSGSAGFAVHGQPGLDPRLGYAPEHVEGMWRMLQTDEPEDIVLATGVGYTVKQFVETAFSHAGLSWEDHVKFDAAYVRPTEVDALIGGASRAGRRLGWKATVLGDESARLIVDADIHALAREGRHWIDTPQLASSAGANA
jgi:GDPmannose 4,6-dehydratase